MGWRNDQCKKVCWMIDDFLANRPTERDSLIVAVQKAFDALEKSEWTLCSKRMPEEHEWIGTKRFGTTISDEVYVTFEAPDGQRFADHLSFQNGKLSRSDEQRMKEYIKKQQAIDAVVGCTNCGTEDVLREYVIKHSLENGWTGGIVDALDAIEQLPSAQPERTCVNCGRTVNNGGWYADGGTRCPIEEHYALPKDGYCHLWEKRNVTDDDYPERRTDE